MIIVDTSVWADHFRKPDGLIHERLLAGDLVTHPMVIGELAMGNLSPWRETLRRLQAIGHVVAVGIEDLLDFVAEHKLAGTGIGFVDAHLLASARREQMTVWTRDKRLLVQAERLRLAHLP